VISARLRRRGGSMTGICRRTLEWSFARRVELDDPERRGR
jgi:hypothetical protein